MNQKELSRQPTMMRCRNNAVVNLIAVAALCVSATASHAAPPIAQVSFSATIERVSAPERVTLPVELAQGAMVTGSISFQDGIRRKMGTGRGFYWHPHESNSVVGTASVQFDAPLNTQAPAAFLALSLPPAEKLHLNCNIGINPGCGFSGGITLGHGGQVWKPKVLSFQAPGTVAADLSQRQAVERLVEISNDKQSKILVTYKETPDDSDTKAVRVVLSIDSMKMQ